MYKEIVKANFSESYKLIILILVMLLPAEIESKTLIPALRAILAKNLAENHNVREDEISKMLGVTQAAISNYIRGTRGDPELIKKYFQKNINVLNSLGRLLNIAYLKGSKVEVNLLPIMLKRLTVSGSTLRIRSNDEKKLIAPAGLCAQIVITGLEGIVARFIRNEFKENPSSYLDNYWQVLERSILK